MAADELDVRLVGRIAKAHGVRGEVIVDPRTDSVDVRFAVGTELSAIPRDGVRRTLVVASARAHGERLLVRFEDVAGRDAAEELRGAALLADTSDLPACDDPDEFYDHELEGLAVVALGGERIGTVREVLHGVGGDLLVVDRDGDGGGSPVLVPFVHQIVPEVDIRGRRVVVDPPQGLLDIG